VVVDSLKALDPNRPIREATKSLRRTNRAQLGRGDSAFPTNANGRGAPSPDLYYLQCFLDLEKNPGDAGAISG
jgi:hypothetical protein